ncbi:MAG: SDR family NAD(P)-dependent oxidoreductase [Betaproteobacteria bacterium]|nr:MAG: SDR family NAD(P)-dependent oxidoreductase [Betaproteobacteria bacterium]
MADPVCLITGAGDGIGAATARRFASEGYRIAMLARTEERLKRLEKEMPGSRGYVCDISDLDLLRTTVTKAREELGPISVAVHNAAQGAFKTILEADPVRFEELFRINTTALMVLTQCVAPDMLDAGKGAIMVTGNTSAWRGKPRFCMFAPTKAAQRILAEAIARDLGPKGIHVAYITIDAAVDTPWTRPRIYPNKPDDFFAKPSAIADTIYHVAHQDPSAWTFNVDVRPYHESW